MREESGYAWHWGIGAGVLAMTLWWGRWTRIGGRGGDGVVVHGDGMDGRVLGGGDVETG